MAALLTAGLFTGCATQSPPVETTSTPVEESALPTEKPVVYKNFEPETLYSLLVADMALDRGRYEIGLGNYVQQAHTTRDPAVAARATRIARYLGASQATLSTSLLWLELEPSNLEARVIAANELAQVGRLTEAFEIALPLARSPAQSIFQTIAARASQAPQPQREILLAAYTDLADKNPEQTELLISKGLLLQATEQYDAALAIAEAVLKKEPDNISAASLEAKVLQQLGREQEARQRLQALLERNPNNQRLRLDYARLLADHDLNGAREQFEILLKQSPGDANYIFSLALINNELGDLSTAKLLFTQLLEHPSRGPSAHFYLGEIANKEGDKQAALEHYQQVDSGPDFMVALGRSADILIEQGNLDAVRQRFQELRSNYSNQEERLYLAESEVLSQHQLLDLAVEVLTEGLTFHPKSAPLLYARAMLNEQRNRLALMESDLRTIIDLDTSNATALNALGYTLADRTNRYQEAFDLINQALSLKPGDPAIIDSMGWVQYRMGNFEEAISRLREAMKAFPDHEVAAHLGEVLWVTGAEQEAEAVWQEGLRLNPASEIIPKVMERLKATP
ncbi:tetratricopeptide repeat protein [Halioxenophilus sp. WMMB6]|uniref:tetratricopeptide repeat protein n=1 Tax=Halioxenophilus sp. WMMB6 TaxID=3073815 RepID=UPI00295F4278|nr:tetratricopeptide repeat protein [Halioxenophilus sp. WMMB6]